MLRNKDEFARRGSIPSYDIKARTDIFVEALYVRLHEIYCNGSEPFLTIAASNAHGIYAI